MGIMRALRDIPLAGWVAYGIACALTFGIGWQLGVLQDAMSR